MTRVAAICHALGVVVACATLGAVRLEAEGGAAAVAVLDTLQARIGDPLRLTLRVEGAGQGTRVLFPASLEPYLAQRMQAAVVDSSMAQQRVYDLRLFDVGRLTVPSLPVALVTQGDTLRLQTPPVEVEITPVRRADETELRQIKPPWAIPGGIPIWFVAVVVAVACVLVAFLVSRYLLRRTPPAPVATPPPPTDYCREFSRIEAMGLLQRGALKLYYTHLADVLRRFLEEKVGMDALERTTEEIRRDLRAVAQLDDDLRARLLQFLEVADLVKFARLQPPVEEAGQMPRRGRALVTEVEACLAPAPSAGMDAPDPVAVSTA